MPAIEISDDDVQAAAAYQTAAVEKVIRFHYPLVCRLAFGISGSLSRGTSIVGGIVGRSLHVLKSWTTAAQAKNWFLHHTLLECRRLDVADSADDDPLLTRTDDSNAYRAFIMALRKLPIQQREAFLLTHGEKFDMRQTAIAMDCSTTAAAHHLAAAQKDLALIAGEEYQTATSRMAIIYAALEPGEALIIGDIAQHVGRFMQRRRWRRLVNAVLTVITLAVLAWIVWRLYRMIEG